jgi:hypothetical protein
MKVEEECLLEVKQPKNLEDIISIVDRLDFTDIQIIRKFYLLKSGCFNSQPYCFPILYKEMKNSGQIKMGVEGFRKRLENLVRIGFLKKVKRSNPTIYLPVEENKEIVLAVIKRFFFVNGLEQYL